VSRELRVEGRTIEEQKKQPATNHGLPEITISLVELLADVLLHKEGGSVGKTGQVAG